MQIGETRVFQTKQQCRLTEKDFIVLKVLSQGYFYFYAVSGASNGFQEVHSRIPQKYAQKFEHQLAYIACTRGWIHQLTVFEKISGAEGRREDARGCGVGTILTELCLMDPEINTLKEGSKAIRVLAEGVKDLVQQNCYKLVGLTMAAYPSSAAHVYFSAAINMGYDKLIVDFSGFDAKSGGRTIKYNVYDTLVAKQNYKNGNIEACCGNERCSAQLRPWIFCADEYPFFVLEKLFANLSLS